MLEDFTEIELLKEKLTDLHYSISSDKIKTGSYYAFGGFCIWLVIFSNIKN